MAGENPNPTPGGETPPAAGAGAAPEPSAQAKPWYELKGFKSEQEALAAWDESQRTLSDAQTRAAAAERALEVVTAAPAKADGGNPSPADPGYRRYFQGKNLQESYADPEKYGEDLLSATDRLVEDRVTAILARQEAARKQREAFFKDHKDLEPFPELVARHTQSVMTENPRISYADGVKEVARRARAEIAVIKAGGASGAPTPSGEPQKPKEALPHVGGGGPETGSPAAPKTPETKTEKDPVQSEVERRIAEREKKSILR